MNWLGDNFSKVDAINRELQRTSGMFFDDLTKTQQNEILYYVEECNGNVRRGIRRWQLEG